MLRILSVSAAAAVATLLPASAFAQEAGAQPNEFEALTKCRTIASDSERLACFDRAVGVVIAAEESGEIRIIDKAAAEKTRRSLFGFTLPDLALFGGKSEELEVLETTIKGVRRGSGDSWTFQTEEGAVWQIQDLSSRRSPPQVGQPVEFKKASLGSYFIRLNGQLGVKGRRVE